MGESIRSGDNNLPGAIDYRNAPAGIPDPRAPLPDDGKEIAFLVVAGEVRGKQGPLLGHGSDVVLPDGLARSPTNAEMLQPDAGRKTARLHQ